MPHRYCGRSSIHARSYAIPTRFPFPPALRLVMERTPKSCDLFADRSFCAAFAADRTFEPEFHVREVIASFLDGCHQRSCVALDIGANLGWFTAMMLALGANVTAVEPQADLAISMRETIELNCWATRARVLTAFLDAAQPGEAPIIDGASTRPVTQGWRAGRGWPQGQSLAFSHLFSRLSSLSPLLCGWPKGLILPHTVPRTRQV